MTTPIANYYLEKAIRLEEAKAALLLATQNNDTDELFKQIQCVEQLTFLVSKTAGSKIRTVDSIGAPQEATVTPQVTTVTPQVATPVLTSTKSRSWFPKF